MGSPMVFPTAPPQPASKARMICSPQLVGGAEASQKGLGLLMAPAKLRTRRSGSGPDGSPDWSLDELDMRHLLRLECGQDAERGALAIGYGIHHLTAAVG